MAEFNQLQRSLRVLQYLAVRDRVTVHELFEHFNRGIPERTLQRTLGTLEESGLPLRRETGAHGQALYSLARSFRFLPQLLTPDEALAAILLAQFGEHFEGSPVGEALEQVIGKLEQLLPLNGVVARSGILGLDDAFQIKQPGKVAGGPRGQGLLRLLQAILEQRVCSLRYRKLGGEAEGRLYTIQPYSLVLVSGAIYLIARQPGQENWTHLAVQRMLAVELLDQTFEREADFNLARFLNGSFGIWQAEPEQVVIQFSALVAEFVGERSWHPSQQLATAPDGSLELTMTVGISSELEAWILRWGAHARVLQPARLSQRIRQLLSEALDNYADVPKA